jgi:uncharacterized protein (TIGR02117 family)
VVYVACQLLLVLLLLGAGCTPPASELPTSHEPGTVIYVVGQGWHTGLVMRRQDIAEALWPEHRDFPEAQYLEIGWGDQQFYQAPEGTLGLALKAALNSTASVLHVVGLRQPPEVFFPGSEIIAVRLSPHGFARLCTYIHDAYKKDAAGQAMSLGPGLHEYSRFYRAEGRYHLFYTCNTWLAEALQVAGCPINPSLVLTTESLMSRVRTFGTTLQAPRSTQAQPEGVAPPSISATAAGYADRLHPMSLPDQAG